MEEKTCNATITYREDVTDELYIIRVTPDEGTGLGFEPGQYGEIGIPETHIEGDTTVHKFVRRPYSIASAPSAGNHLEFFIVLVPDGAITPKLWHQKVGDRVWLGPKIKGKFTLDLIPEGKDLVFVATGTGLAPFISMIREFHGKGRWKNLAVVHCARLAKDLAYAEELKALAAKDPHFKYIPTVTREPDGSPWAGLRGRVQPIFEPAKFRELTGFDLSPETCQVMICGNPEMISGLQDQLGAFGFKEHKKKDPGQIHFERFW